MLLRSAHDMSDDEVRAIVPKVPGKIIIVSIKDDPVIRNTRTEELFQTLRRAEAADKHDRIEHVMILKVADPGGHRLVRVVLYFPTTEH